MEERGDNADFENAAAVEDEDEDCYDPFDSCRGGITDSQPSGTGTSQPPSDAPPHKPGSEGLPAGAAGGAIGGAQGQLVLDIFNKLQKPKDRTAEDTMTAAFAALGGAAMGCAATEEVGRIQLRKRIEDTIRGVMEGIGKPKLGSFEEQRRLQEEMHRMLEKNPDVLKNFKDFLNGPLDPNKTTGDIVKYLEKFIPSKSAKGALARMVLEHLIDQQVKKVFKLGSTTASEMEHLLNGKSLHETFKRIDEWLRWKEKENGKDLHLPYLDLSPKATDSKFQI